VCGNAETGSRITKSERCHEGLIRCVVFGADARVLVSGGDGRSIIIWELGEGGKAAQKRTLEGHTGVVSSISLSPEGTHLASGGDEGAVRIWEVATGQQVRVLNGHSGRSVNGVAWSPDGKYIVSSDDHEHACVWKAADVQVRGRMHVCTYAYMHVAMMCPWHEYTHTHTYTYTYIYIYIYIYIHTYTYPHTDAYKCSCFPDDLS
jgi:WD40 repeat protein